MSLTLSLRPTTMDDADFLLRLRNDPATVAASRQQRPVAGTDHLAWLAMAICNPAITLSVAAMGALRVGTVRLDHEKCPDGCATELSLTVAPSLRGRGLARQIILLAMDANPYQCRRWSAEVRRENIPSLRGFLSVGWLIAGYRAEGFVVLEHERISEVTPQLKKAS